MFRRSALIGLLVVAGVVTAPALGASASAETTPKLTVTVAGPPGSQIAVSLGRLQVTQSGGGGEAISVTSESPSVCEVIGDVFGPNEEVSPEEEVTVEVRYTAPGACVFVARVNATSTTEASEGTETVNVVAGPGRAEAPGPAPTIPELSLEGSDAGSTSEAQRPGYVDESERDLYATSSRPGLRIASLTPAICGVASTSQAPGAFAVRLELLASGTCRLAVSLPKTAEHEALEVTRSILVATATITSTPPSPAVAGGSYYVTASATPELPVVIGVEGGACTLTRPTVEQSLPARGHSEPSARPPEAPQTVYLLRAGTCTVTAGGASASTRVSQTFAVTAGAPEQIAFTSTPPTAPTVGESYVPTATSSLGWPLSFSAAPSSVCKIVLGSSRSEKETINGVLLPPSAVDLVGAGMCTVDAGPSEELGGEALGAQQSFLVQAAAPSTDDPIGSIVSEEAAPTEAPIGSTAGGGSAPAGRTLEGAPPPPTSSQSQPPSSEANASTPPRTSRPRSARGFEILGRPRIKNGAALELRASFGDPGTLSWRVTFRPRDAGAARTMLFARGRMKIRRASTPSLTIRPTKAALTALARARTARRGLSLRLSLTFQPSSGGRPVSRERSLRAPPA